MIANGNVSKAWDCRHCNHATADHKSKSKWNDIRSLFGTYHNKVMALQHYKNVNGKEFCYDTSTPKEKNEMKKYLENTGS